MLLLLAAFAASVCLPYDTAQAGKPPAKIYKLKWVATALGFPDSNAGGINDAGDVVGVAWWPEGTIEAFLYTPTGGMMDLKAITDLGSYSQSGLRAFRINNNNWILAELGGQACLLEPVLPLP